MEWGIWDPIYFLPLLWALGSIWSLVLAYKFKSWLWLINAIWFIGPLIWLLRP